MSRNGLDLKQLHALTRSLMRDDHSIMRTLNWVDQVLPYFANACRLSLRAADAEAIELWLAWMEHQGAPILAEAGKGEVYRWRQIWLRLLLETTLEMQRNPAGQTQEAALQKADALFRRYGTLSTCFTAAFWLDLVRYLHDGSGEAIEAWPAAPQSLQGVAFPLVLSEPVVDGGNRTNVILAEFLFEPVPSFTSSVSPHPAQAVVRCMDESFARCFQHAATVAQRGCPASRKPLPDVRVRIQTVKPEHERFLQGTVLRGSSSAGALAVGLHGLYHGRSVSRSDCAISFALTAASTMEVDGDCYPVGGADDKIRGCARQDIRSLLMARTQQERVLRYAAKHGIEVLGAADFSEAVEIASIHGSRPLRPSQYKIVVVYNRHVASDEYLSRMLERRLSAGGHQVFIDRHLPIGIAWAQEIERQIPGAADAIVVLLSSASIVSDMLAGEIETAYEAQQKQEGKPRLLPVRVEYEGALPERLGYILDPLQHALWRGPHEDGRLMVDLERGLQHTGEDLEPVEPARTSWRSSELPDDLEPFDGPVPLQSRFYVVRQADPEFLSAVHHRHAIILIKGSRQVGKSSLLARGLNLAHQSGMKTALTDFQKLSVSELRSPEAFYQALARMLARQLKLEASLEDLWVAGRSANVNFEEYMEDHVLPHATPLVWGMDEVDRVLLSAPFSSDVFGLLRSWANERQARPGSPWNGVTLMMAYATEAHLFIKDLNQSPFNIGTRFELKDFTVHEVADLNERYGFPLRDDLELARFFCLVGGQPYLVRRGLYSMVRQKIDIDTFESEAGRDRGPIGDHLRRIVTLLAHSPENAEALRAILSGKPCPSYEAFYHLRSAGVVVGDALEEARPRCQLYATYLEQHLNSG